VGRRTGIRFAELLANLYICPGSGDVKLAKLPVPLRIFQYKIFSRDVPVQNTQSVVIFQYKMFSQ
jgi:hypothetical protein